MILLLAMMSFVRATAYEPPRQANEIRLDIFGAVGDGVADDSRGLQRALDYCSRLGATCYVPGGKTYLVTQPLFIWGKARLSGAGASGALVFNVSTAPYLLNVGISSRNLAAAPFSGEISGINFRIAGGAGGRIIYFWRTDGANITHNTFDVGHYAYSATSSGNDNQWLLNGFDQCIRRNVRIVGNRIIANGREAGSEGIGLANFDGATIADNEIIGVGDDPVGIHFSSNVVIRENEIRSVDGRVFVANSTDIEIAGNHVARMPAISGGRWYPGIALVYVGAESAADSTQAVPARIRIHDNVLYYPAGAVDRGAAINLNGVRDASVANNAIVNDSAQVEATAFHMAPIAYADGRVGRVAAIDMRGNVSTGTRALDFVMTGNCKDYSDSLQIRHNVARAFDFYCDQVTVAGNVSASGSSARSARPASGR